MKFLSAEIEEFGKLSGKRFTFGPRMNLIEGPNESGKSTLLAFLRFALYGFPRATRPEGDERERRLSWQGQRAAGKLTLETEDGIFSIARSITRQGNSEHATYAEQLLVTELESGKEVTLSAPTPGEHFLGLSPQLFDSSLYLRQSDVDRVTSREAGEAARDLLFAGDAGSGADTAEERLQALRRELQHLKGRGGLVADLEDEIARLCTELDEAREASLAYYAVKADADKYRHEIEDRRERLQLISTAVEQATIASTLAVFEQAHTAQDVRDRKRLDFESILVRNQSWNLPTPEAVTLLENSSREYAIAFAEGAQMEEELSRLRAVKHNATLLEAAENIRAEGGAEVVLNTFHAATKHRKWCGICSLMTFGYALIAAIVTAILMPRPFAFDAALFKSITAPYLWCGLGALLFLAVSLFFFFKRASHHRRIKRLLRTLHVTNASMLRTYLSQCSDEESAAVAHTKQLTALEAKQAAAMEAVRSADTRIRETLAPTPWAARYANINSLPAILSEIAALREQAKTELDAARVESERAAAALEALTASLAGQDEAKLRARFTGKPETGIDELKKRQAFLQESIAGLDRKRIDLEREEAILASKCPDTKEKEARIAALTEELEAAKNRLKTVNLALAALKSATEELQKSVSPALCERASELLSDLTNGAYTTLHTTADFAVTLDSPVGPLPLSRFSAGCRDAACLALRLGLLSTVTEKQLPLLFDEALARLDDSHAAALLSTLQAYCRRGGQCLLFTCHSREATLLEGTPFQRIEMA